MKYFTAIGLLVFAAAVIASDGADISNNTAIEGAVGELPILTQAIPQEIPAHLPIFAGSIAPLVENGYPVRQGDLPHHVTIYIKKGGQWRFCSGALVSPNWVITTLVPLFNANEVRVYHGSHQLPSSKLAFGKRVVPHPKYDARNGLNNVALVQLSQNVVVDRFTSPVVLPPIQFKTTWFDNQYIFVSGYGSKNGQPQKTLAYGQFRVTSNQYCRSKYPHQASLWVFCALSFTPQRKEYLGYGDVGAPALLRVRNQNILIGLYAFGAPEQVAKGEPTAFINICPSIEWIRSIIQRQ